MRLGGWLGVFAMGALLASACGDDDTSKTKISRPAGTGGTSKGSTGGSGGKDLGAAGFAGDGAAGSSTVAAGGGAGTGARGSGGTGNGGTGGAGGAAGEAGSGEAGSGEAGIGAAGSGGSSGSGGRASNGGKAGKGGASGAAGKAGAAGGGAGGTSGGAGVAGAAGWPACEPPLDVADPTAAIPAPALYWRFDDADVSSTTLNDHGANDLDGTISGGVTTGVSGRIGQAFQFDGSSGYVTGAAGTSALKVTPISVSAWINVPAPVSAGGVFMSLGHGAVPYTGFIIEARTTNQVMFGTEGGDATQEVPVYQCLDFGRWVHYVVIFDDSTLSIYRDGVYLQTAPAGYASIAYGSYPVVAGRHPFFMNRYFNGRLDELAVWSQALSAAEVLSVYAAGIDGTSLVP